MKHVLHNLAFTGGIALAIAGIADTVAADLTENAKNEQVADARRETQILTSFRMNRNLRAYDLTVLVDGDRAALGGAVESDAARDLAGQVAAGVHGVEAVDNRIRIDASAVPRKRDGTEARRADTRVEDATITAAVESMLSWNSHTEGLDAHVDTRNGSVTLAGSSISYAERDTAGLVARAIDGVVDVNNQLVLTNDPRTSDRAARVRQSERARIELTDSWITSTVKSALTLTRGISGFDIAVSTSDGVVSLNGVVDSNAVRELAMQVAQDVRGVKQVDAAGLTVG
jgi:hyperosmotically inducible periplasmic protein